MSSILLAGCGQPVETPEALAGRVRPPDGWTKAGPDAYTAPGRILAAWNGPEGSSLVVYRTLPIPKPSAEALATETANRLRNTPGMSVETTGVESLGPELPEAARVEVVGRGTGDALKAPVAGAPADTPPDGRQTRRIAVALPFADDRGTIWLVWHCPAEAADAIRPQAEATLRALAGSAG